MKVDPDRTLCQDRLFYFSLQTILPEGKVLNFILLLLFQELLSGKTRKREG